MVLEIIKNSYVAIVITLLLILFILTNNNFEKRVNRFFLAASITVFLLIIEETWEVQLSLKPTYTYLRVVLSAIGYSLRPLIPCLLLILVKKRSRKNLFFLSLPLCINALISFSALFCKLVFWYTENNEFMRGPLGVIPFLTAAFYVAALLVNAIQDCKKGRFMEATVVSAIVLLAFFSTVLESVFHLHFIQIPSMAISISFFYMYLHSIQNSRDTLTGAMTRKRFYLDSKKYNLSLSAVISLDLNDLKKINDVYGHLAGDQALKAVSSVIMKYTSPRVTLYRIGGDEFMILCFKKKEKDVLEIIENIRKDLEQGEYKCAIGYALYSTDENFDHACQAADMMMYMDKRKMKNTL